MPFLRSFSFWLLLVVVALLPFHAFLVTIVGSLVGATNDFVPVVARIFASWKEGALLFLGALAVARFFFDSDFSFRWRSMDTAILSLFLIAAALQLWQPIGWGQWGMGAVFDFRFFAIFWLARTLPWDAVWRRRLFFSVAIPAAIVVLFGFIVQFSPVDLTAMGYSSHFSSYMPEKPLPAYHTVEGTKTIRAASTLAGPNQLGAYLLFVVALLLAFFRKSMSKKWFLFFIFSITVVVVLLFFTFSRSAWIGAAAIMAIAAFRALPSHRIRFFFLGVGIFSVSIAAMALLHWAPAFFNSAIVRVGSTGEHARLTNEAISSILKNPLGEGLGSAGPASQRYAIWPDHGRIAENWFLQIFQELGVVGGVLMIILFCWLGSALFRQSNANDNIAFAAVLALIGVSIQGVFLHSWSDATISMIVFALSGAVLSDDQKTTTENFVQL